MIQRPGEYYYTIWFAMWRGPMLKPALELKCKRVTGCFKVFRLRFRRQRIHCQATYYDWFTGKGRPRKIVPQNLDAAAPFLSSLPLNWQSLRLLRTTWIAGLLTYSFA